MEEKIIGAVESFWNSYKNWERYHDAPLWSSREEFDDYCGITLMRDGDEIENFDTIYMPQVTESIKYLNADAFYLWAMTPDVTLYVDDIYGFGHTKEKNIITLQR